MIGADVVGMTGAHEASLVAEAGLPYAMFGVVDNMANGVAAELSVESFLSAQKARGRGGGTKGSGLRRD